MEDTIVLERKGERRLNLRPGLELTKLARCGVWLALISCFGCNRNVKFFIKFLVNFFVIFISLYLTMKRR